MLPEVSCHGYAENGNMAGRSCFLVLKLKIVLCPGQFHLGKCEAPEEHRNIPTLGWKSNRMLGKTHRELVTGSGIGLKQAYCLHSAYALIWRCWICSGTDDLRRKDKIMSTYISDMYYLSVFQIFKILPVSGEVGGTRLLLIIKWSAVSIMSYTLSPWATKST